MSVPLIPKAKAPNSAPGTESPKCTSNPYISSMAMAIERNAPSAKASAGSSSRSMIQLSGYQTPRIEDAHTVVPERAYGFQWGTRPALISETMNSNSGKNITGISVMSVLLFLVTSAYWASVISVRAGGNCAMSHGTNVRSPTRQGQSRMIGNRSSPRTARACRIREFNLRLLPVLAVAACSTAR